MSFLNAAPDVLSMAATDLAGIGSTMGAAQTAAAAQTMGLEVAAADEVSAAIAEQFGTYAREFHALGAQAAAFHARFVQAVKASVASYVAAESVNVGALLETTRQDLLGAINTAAEALLGRPLIGTGMSVAAGQALGGAAKPLADLVANTLVMGGTGMPIPSTSFINAVNNLFIQPNLAGTIASGLVTPEQTYPFTGVKSLTADASVSLGVQILHDALQPYLAAGNPVGVFGYSQSATIASLVMAQLQAAGVPSSAVHFVLIGDPMNPNGGLFARFAGLQLPSLGMTFYGATPADAYPTTIYTVEYDSFADFPRYPLNFLSVLNALQSQTHFSYTTLTPAQIESAVQLPTSGPTQTTYYMIPTTDLPLLDGVRDIPIIGHPIADLLQPDLRYLVNMGYGDPRYGWSTGPANVATPFGLLPPRSAFEMLPGLLASGTQQGIQDFIGDFTGTGPHPVTLPSLNSLNPLLDPSSGTAGVTTALTNPLAAISNVTVNPAAVAAALPDIANTLSSVASTAYGVLLPTADIINAGLISVPAYDLSLFLDNLSNPIYAVGLPLAANAALYPLLISYEIAALNGAAASIAADLTSLL